MKYNYIERKYWSGGLFSYDLSSECSIKANVNKVQVKSNELKHEMNEHKNEMMNMYYRMKDMKSELNKNYCKMRSELVMEGVNIEDKIKQDADKQRIVNMKLMTEINEVKYSLRLFKEEVEDMKKRVERMKNMIL